MICVLFPVPEAPSMQVQVIDSTSVQVTWEPVPPTEAKMDGYRLTVSKPGGNVLRLFNLLPDYTQQLISKLGQ